MALRYDEQTTEEVAVFKVNPLTHVSPSHQDKPPPPHTPPTPPPHTPPTSDNRATVFRGGPLWLASSRFPMDSM